ncbi:MAG TPA: hypothetical protein VGQ53_08490 [Chitinophagaceae bacterium]|jgi:hypothetical protein|nr:hypothetical protein [Chitinophagaceae bacterium]
MNSTQKKSSLFGILLLALVIISNAQTGPVNKFYLQGGIGASSYSGGSAEVGFQTIFKNKWSATLSYQTLTMDPRNEPSDYQAETGYVFFMPYTNEVDTRMSVVSLTAGRYFKLGKKTWATTEGGLSYVSGEKVNFERTEVTSSNIIIFAYTGSNYTTSKETKSSLGVAMRADLNWAFASFMGLGCGVFANINSIQSPVGFQVKLIVGKMGREKKNK